MPRKREDVAVNGRKRSYRAYDENTLNKVIASIKSKKISINFASTKYSIPKGTLINKIHGKHMKSVGSPLVLSEVEEKVIVEHMIMVGEWGFPFCKNDLRYLVKHYLDKCDRKVLQFNENLPTPQWAARFLMRHKKETSEKKCQNLKRSKGQLNAEDMKKYFDNLKETLTQEDGSFVPPHRIFNFDETNLSDDPGSKKCIFKRGTKYPERIMDHSKSSTSVMYCGSASGDILSPYVVYKSLHLYKSWMEGGPPHTRYNRSKSGWFDGVIFNDWFIQMFLPYVKKHKLNDEGKVILMGDNLSSHFSAEVLQLCRDNKIAFVCLPKNSTHITQPLDVAFYRPLKTFWRSLLENWKMKQRKMQTITKEKFPSLLRELHEKLVDANNQSKNLIAGFKKCGVSPFDPDQVISRLPEVKANIDKTENVSAAVLDMLKELRSEDKTQKKQRRTKINIEPGKSVELEDLEKLEEQKRLNDDLKKSGKVGGKKKLNNRIKTKGKSGENNDGGSSAVQDISIEEKIAKKRSVRGSGKNTVKLKKDDSKETAKGRKRKCQDKKTIPVKRTIQSIESDDDFYDNGSSNEMDEPDSDDNRHDNFEFDQPIRPSLSDIHLGDFVVVEYLLKRSKKYFIGLVKNKTMDVLNVTFLVKSGTNFAYPAMSNLSLILPTQVVKALPIPLEKRRGTLTFDKEAIRGFRFEQFN